MKKLLFIFTFLLLPMLAIAKGVGYGKTEWGMTPSQVVMAENSRRVNFVAPIKYGIGVGKVQIENVEVASSFYTVTFIFDNSDHLIQTNLISNEKKNIGILKGQFASLSQLLTQKYGSPKFKDTDTVIWQTADTTIKLSRLILVPTGFAQVGVHYIPNSKVVSETSNL